MPRTIGAARVGELRSPLLAVFVSERWYRAGLRFECTQCGACCSGEPGYVWVDDEEIAAMAGVMKMTVADFEAAHIRSVGPDKSLKERSDGDCVLLDVETRRCLAYEGRPVQCQTWPFWDSTVKRQKDWEDTCETCPGAGTGKLYSLEQIEVRRRRKSV